MTVRFIAQYPTVQFGYVRVEVEGDNVDATFAEFQAADAGGAEHAARLTNPQSPAQAVGNLQAGGVVPQGQAGTGLPQVSGPPPWAATNQQEQQQFQPPAQQQGWQPSAPQQPTQGQGPTCQHGPAKYVPAGVSKSSGKPYQAFWACQAPQGQPKCKF